MPKSDIEAIVEALWKAPTKENWGKFVKALPKSKLKYYKVVFKKGKIKRVGDLVHDYAELYDAKEKLVTKIPIYQKNSGKIDGATYFMKGLLTLNRVDEWIKA
jgi:hypothetical protein